MSGDLLPEWVNLFLDDFETSLCLPILVVMILCTAQFVFNHAFDIGNVIYQNVRAAATEGAQNTNDMMGKLKGLTQHLENLSSSLRIHKRIRCFLNLPGILTTLGVGTAGTNAIQNPPSPTNDANSPEEEWDYCEDYCELE
ncbi:PREDICTED: uncharacterized protein LOC106744102 [Dinoponera quadriceps]|uniref:Uncharacterized protein LOC106744102 n=1 Tax=Dinoponera quadriceps TaxID=609295 RepID=A0A6P3X821_DINQU|nr:PREDICTED: uncharacterized protein LOC106744102 [Dinoponera quadriceps]